MRAAGLAILLAACAPSLAELRAPVDEDVARRLGGTQPAAADIAALLSHPVDVGTAVRVALANNARLAAAFDELGIAGGELAAATAVGPLEVDLQLRYGAGGSGPRATEHELEVIQPVLGLIELPRRRTAAHADIAAARANATAMAVRLAARVDIAFRDVLAAQQEIELRKTAFEAADVAATLRERMRDAGNTTELAVARDQDAREQARIDLVRATAEVTARKLRVDALLGIGHLATDWVPAGAVEELPASEPQLDTVENDAVAASLAVTAGTARVAAARARLSDERLRSWLPDLGVGVSALDRDGAYEVGPAVRVGLPLFDWRSGPRAQATARLAGAQHELIADATELRTRARAVAVEAHAAYAEAKALHDTVLPLRQKIVDETLAHYNAMDADPFQLVVARRELVAAGHAYLDALRRYGNAMSEVTALRRGVALEETP